MVAFAGAALLVVYALAGSLDDHRSSVLAGAAIMIMVGARCIIQRYAQRGEKEPSDDAPSNNWTRTDLILSVLVDVASVGIWIGIVVTSKARGFLFVATFVFLSVIWGMGRILSAYGRSERTEDHYH